MEASVPPVIIGDQIVWQLGELPASSDDNAISITVEVDASAPLLQTVVTRVEITTASSELEKLNNTSQSETYLGYLYIYPLLRR